MQYNTLLARIAADIYSNGAELITGDILQNVLNEMVGALASAGACYKGTITPASAAPLDLDQPTVYLALTAGTYTNFVDSNNDPIVTTGPALITYDGGAQLVFSKTDLPSGSPDAVLYTPQTLTNEQKVQARSNIGAASASDVTSIESYIPAQASSSNQLADKNFVNSSIQTATATFKGNWETWEDVPELWKEYLDEARPDSNDYLVVRDASDYAPLWDSLGDTAVYEPGDIVSVSITSSTYGLYRCIAIVDYSVDPTLSPEEDTTHWEEVSSNPAYEGTWRFKYAGTWGIDGKWGWLPEYQVNEKPLTAEQLAALNSGITDTKVAKLDALPATIPTEVFWATYVPGGTSTSASDIENALNNSKLVLCYYNNVLYQFERITSAYIFLSAITDSGSTFRSLRVSRGTASWTPLTSYEEVTANKVSTISGNETDTTKYPNTKAVADALGKMGVISQVQTWTTEPALNTPAVYQMSDHILGIIPQAFIDLAESIGATFNPNGYQAGVGYFELNGLTDLSYEEMIDVYNLKGIIDYMAYNGGFPLRALKKCPRTLPPISNRANTQYSLNYAFRIATNAAEKTYIEAIGIGTESTDLLISSGFSEMLYSAQYLRYFGVNGALKPNSSAASFSLAFTYCHSLTSVRIYGLCQNIDLAGTYFKPAIDLASIVYMVENAANTAVITIKVSPTTYGYCQADTTEYTYQGNTYTGILALATAKNISIGQA